jgi:hypothetical protein
MLPAVPLAYLSRKLTRPLVTKDGGALRTVLDARAYMLALSKDREHRTQWQGAADCCLTGATYPISARRLSWRYSMTPNWT